MFICTLREGQGLMIGTRRVVVSGIPGDGSAMVEIMGVGPVTLYPDRRVEVLPEVWAYTVGRGLSKVKVHVSAPRDVQLRLILDGTASGRDSEPHGDPAG